MLFIKKGNSAILSLFHQYRGNTPRHNEERLQIPYSVLNFEDLMDILFGKVNKSVELGFSEKVIELKEQSLKNLNFPGIDTNSITVDSPIPFSLKRLWYELIDNKLKTFDDKIQKKAALLKTGDPNKLKPPQYKSHGMGSQAPFKNRSAKNIIRQLNLIRTRLLDRRFEFLLRPGIWEPDYKGNVKTDVDRLLASWLGQSKPLTILDLSGVPSAVLEKLVGSILKIVYESMFWGREKSGGGIDRPLLIVMEEAHRYLSSDTEGLASRTVQNIVKENRKYGVGAMIVNQRPSEVNETILSQCGTFFALRLSNPNDRERVRETLPDGLTSLVDVLPALRVGEAIVMGESAKLPMRCRVSLPAENHQPKSTDPEVSVAWSSARKQEGYSRIFASWRSQNPRIKLDSIDFEFKTE